MPVHTLQSCLSALPGPLPWNNFRRYNRWLFQWNYSFIPFHCILSWLELVEYIVKIYSEKIHVMFNRICIHRVALWLVRYPTLCWHYDSSTMTKRNWICKLNKYWQKTFKSCKCHLKNEGKRPNNVQQHCSKEAFCFHTQQWDTHEIEVTHWGLLYSTYITLTKGTRVIQCLFTAFRALWDIVCSEKVGRPWSKNQSANCASLLVWSPLWSLFPC